MGEQVLYVIGQDVLRDEPASEVFGKGRHISENGIDEDVFMAGDIKVFSRSHELTQFPVVIHPLQPFLTEEIAEDMLQPGSIAGEILIENICHLSFENEHSGEDVAAVSLSLLLVKRTVCEN